MNYETLTYTIQLKAKLFLPLLFLISSVLLIQDVTSNNFSFDLEEEKIFIDNYESRMNKLEYTVNYISHPAIVIHSDNDFGNYSLPGIGTPHDPVIIENYNITTTSDKAISIVNTTRYFVIRNCYLNAKIYLYNISYGTGKIDSNNCSTTSSMGIWGKYSDGVEIVNNTCNDHYFYGILLKYCNNVTVNENICERNSKGGII